MDAQRLKDSFAKVAVHGDEMPLFFYSDLFLRHPETREFFPVAMNAQRDRLVQALMQIVSNVDNLSELVPFIQGLGRDHRKFGAVAEHYNAASPQNGSTSKTSVGARHERQLRLRRPPDSRSGSFHDLSPRQAGPPRIR